MQSTLSTTAMARITAAIAVDGQFISGSPFGSGHINDTYRIELLQEGKQRNYILQRINTAIFKQPDELMENILRVTNHQRHKMAQQHATDIERRCLQFFPTRNGAHFFNDSDGGCWRMCQLIERTRTFDIIASAEQALLTAASFARFQKMLIDLPGPRLHETIPNFHHTASRFTDFEQALQQNRAGRAAACQPDIDFALQRRALAPVLIDLMKSGDIPERITHNDSKLNNILLDESTGEAICIIDLDTVMPGSALYDFGDMVRSASCTAAEDESDLSKVQIDLAMFNALVEGYLSEAAAFLNPVEINHLVFSGKLITFEQGIRFLGDYLNGDTYYKIKYPEHNLVRARNQFKLVASIEAHEPEMEEMVRRISNQNY